MIHNDMIHVAVNIDSRYVRFCAVTLVSIFENNKGEQFFIHVLCSTLTADEKKLITDLVDTYHSKVAFYEPNEELLRGFAIRKFSKRISLATYYRCFLAAILPAEVNRVIYLDCDILVLGALRPLWEEPLDGLGVAVVRDTAANDVRRYEVLQYSASYSYFNAGVFLANLDFWRSEDITMQSVTLYHDYPERIIYNDQDILNILFCKQKKEVSAVWNMQDGFYRTYRTDGMEISTEELKHPVVLHFTNRKPWEYDNQHPLRHLFFNYQDLTPWKGFSPFSFLGRLKRFLRLFPFYVHLRKPKYIRI